MGRNRVYGVTDEFLERYGDVLNEQEYELAQMLADNLPNGEIAFILDKSEHAVGVNALRIFAKLAKAALPMHYTSNGCHNCKYRDSKAACCGDCSNQNSKWERVEMDA